MHQPRAGVHQWCIGGAAVEKQHLVGWTDDSRRRSGPIEAGASRSAASAVSIPGRPRLGGDSVDRPMGADVPRRAGHDSGPARLVVRSQPNDDFAPRAWRPGGPGALSPRCDLCGAGFTRLRCRSEHHQPEVTPDGPAEPRLPTTMASSHAATRTEPPTGSRPRPRGTATAWTATAWEGDRGTVTAWVAIARNMRLHARAGRPTHDEADRPCGRSRTRSNACTIWAASARLTVPCPRINSSFAVPANTT